MKFAGFDRRTLEKCADIQCRVKTFITFMQMFREVGLIFAGFARSRGRALELHRSRPTGDANYKAVRLPLFSGRGLGTLNLIQIDFG